MEYSLLKQIVPNRFYYPINFSAHPTHYPSFDCINPGVGNISSPFTYFVPSHFFSNPNLKTKNVPIDLMKEESLLQQEGKGDETKVDSNLVVVPDSKKLDSSTEEEEILNKLNENKRKNLDPAIYDSFLHPKKIKTETLKLQSTAPKLKSLNTEKIEKGAAVNTSNKKVMHKFKFE